MIKYDDETPIEERLNVIAYCADGDFVGVQLGGDEIVAVNLWYLSELKHDVGEEYPFPLPLLSNRAVIEVDDYSDAGDLLDQVPGILSLDENGPDIMGQLRVYVIEDNADSVAVEADIKGLARAIKEEVNRLEAGTSP